MATAMHIVIGAGLGIVALTAAAIAALTIRVLRQLLRQGASAAQEAFQRGDSIGNWWNAEKACSSAHSQHDDQRFAIAAKRAKGSEKYLGDVMVEQRAAASHRIS